MAEDPNRFFTEWDDVVDANMPRTITTQDGVVLRRRTYEELAGFWPGSDIEPFASFINRVTKHVATSKPLEPKWTKARVIDGDLLEFARRLKESPGGDIGVHGRISAAQTLLAGGLVDELRLVIAPNIAGGGRLLDGLPPIRLETIGCDTSPTGYLLVDYRGVPQRSARDDPVPVATVN